MNRSEVTLSLFADYSKAFDTVDHKTLLHKLHSLQFSHSSLNLMNSYLTEREKLVQIDYNDGFLQEFTMVYLKTVFLGPILINLYVLDLSESSTSECLQFVDSTTLYRHCKAKDVTENAKLLEVNINSLESWSNKSNLVFNTYKTKTIYLFQLERCDKNTILIAQNYTRSVRKTPSLKEKLLGKFWE